MANGSNEILTQLLQAYGGPGRSAVVFEPTYLLHARLCVAHAHGRRSRSTSLRRSGSGDRGDRSPTPSRPHPDVVFVCSPNNPTGNAQPVGCRGRAGVAHHGAGDRRRGLHRVRRRQRARTDGRACPQRGGRAHVLARRSRWRACGSATCSRSPTSCGDLQRVRLPYHLSSLTQAAGIGGAAPRGRGDDDPGRHPRTARPHRATELARDRRRHASSRPTRTSCCSCPPRPRREVWQGLLDRGVLVRDLSAVVPNALRVTAGAEDEVDRFLTGLREVLAAMTQDRQRRRAPPRRPTSRVELDLDGSGHERRRHRHPVLRPHAAAAGQARRVGPRRRRARATCRSTAITRSRTAGSALGQALARGARRQGRRPALRLDHGPARRGRRGGRAGPGRAATS